ncbi:ABC transporter ATP-binding protein [Carnimonas bestiolae]|uniref:ABC transporter ATP-binding protein n=1 Tax=Carnimonas bestiolae TaxID=3402172 RepID=UPI003EDBD76A
MIKVENLSKRYHGPFGGGWVLNNISFTIPTNVSVGLIGRNGAGKSTLLRLLGGMDHPDKGKIISDARISWPIGLSGGSKGSMTGRQNVKFVARIHGVKENLAEFIIKVQDFAEIGEQFDRPVSTYSSGMKARLNFGLSLAFDFDVYLSDEATSVGDRAFRDKAKRAFKERMEKSSIVMAAHGEGMLKELCESGVVLEKGNAVWFDDIEDALSAYHDISDGKAGISSFMNSTSV